MKKNRLCRIFTGILFFAWGIAALPGISPAAEKSSAPVLIIADVSGSMQDRAAGFETGEQEDNKQEKCISKADAVKELLVQITKELSDKSNKFGIYRMCHRAGYESVYEPFLPLDDYKDQKEDVKEIIKDKYITKYPVFNRRTPIADTLRQLDEKEFAAINGEIKILFISDGNESFYDLKKDKLEPEKLESDKQEAKNHDRQVIGPLSETKRLKDKYGQALEIYTVFMENHNTANDKKSEPEGAALLGAMASAGSGKNFSGTSLINEKSRLKELVDLLCSSGQ